LVLVKVQRISSYTDPDTGRPGKVIELVEVRKRSGGAVVLGPQSEEASMIQRMLQTALLQMQSLGIMPPTREAFLPKVILYLTEDEYDMLNVKLEVNEIYEITFRDGGIYFRKPTGIG
jgi:hypothetical protein